MITPFDARLHELLGPEDAARLATHPDPPTFLRVNPLATTREALQEALAHGYGLHTEPHPANPLALRVVGGELSPTSTLHHFLGHFVQQSLGSMLPAQLLDARPGERVLDLCASPGSKTTWLAAAMQGRGELWANDVSGVRMQALAARVDASHACHVVTTRCAGERLPNLCSETFDRILADVPCTGLGRREHLAVARERHARTGGANLPEAQYALLLAAVKLTRVGGRIVYSTCSLMPDENEAVLQRIVSRLPVRLVEPEPIAGVVLREGRTRIGAQALDPSLQRARTLTPWDNPSPGFFMAVLEKTDALDARRHARRSDGAESARHEPTLAASDPRVSPILDNVATAYGIDPRSFEPYRFVVGKDAINIVAGEIEHVWQGAFRVGVTLARRRGALWRLSNSSLHRFARVITRNTVVLPREVCEALARTGHAEYALPQAPATEYPALSLDGFGPVASLHHADAQWRWKRAQALALPR